MLVPVVVHFRCLDWSHAERCCGEAARGPHVCWDFEPTCSVRARIVQLAVVPSDTSADKLGFISEQGDEDSLFAFRLITRHCPQQDGGQGSMDFVFQSDGNGMLQE